MKIFHEGDTPNIKIKFSTCPDGLKLKMLKLMIDNEASDSMNTGIIPSDVISWRMTDLSHWWTIIFVLSSCDGQGGELKSNIADVNGMNFSDSWERKQHCDP